MSTPDDGVTSGEQRDPSEPSGDEPRDDGPAPPGGWIEFEPLATPDTAAPAEPARDAAPPPPPLHGPPPVVEEAGTPDEVGSARRRRRWPIIAGVAVLGIGVIAAAAMFLLGDDGPSHPDEWAAEILPFVEIVEDERGLDFLHPVHVDFLAEGEFRSEVTSDESELTDEDREEIERATGLLRAVGLVRGELDLFEATNDLAGDGVVGFYSFDDERIRMRGEELTAARRVTLVHELTHALQDQHFDLGARQEAFEESEDFAAESAFDAIVEGDGRRIEAAYVATLSDEELAELEEEEAREMEEFEAGAEDIPQILQTFFGAPYALGEAMLTLAVALDGNDAVDELFEDPPTSDEHLFDPWTFLVDRDAPKEVTEPKVSEGEEFDRGDFGALAWFFVLAERIDIGTALEAADGWGGDAFVGFERDGVTCARITYRADSTGDLDQMEAALGQWIAAAPGAEASVERSGAQLEFESCDPGPDAAVGSDVSGDALGVALSRTYLGSTIIDSGATESQARCFGDALVRTFSVEQLNDPEYGADDPAVQETIQELALGCR